MVAMVAGSDVPARFCVGLRIHDLRHTAASIGVGEGMNLPVIGRLLGHTQASATQRTAHLDNDPAFAAANRIGAAVSSALDGKRGSDRKVGDTA